MRFGRPWAGRLSKPLIAAVAIGFALLLGEVALRLVRPQELSLNHSAWDPDVGFINSPNITARTRTSEFDMRVEINSRGLRDREFAFEKPANTVRLGVFGDSFTFGHGVAGEEAYPKVLERLANSRPAEPGGLAVEVLNFGIGKTGTSHQLEWYSKEGRRYDLDTVVLGFLAFNDFGDNWDGVHYLEGERLVHTTTGYNTIRRLQAVANRVPFYGVLATRSHLFNLLKKVAAIADDRLRGAKASARNAAAVEERGARQEALYELTLRLVREFRGRAEADGAGFLFVGLPARAQRPSTGHGRGEPVPAKVLRYERLVADLVADGFDVLDLIPVFSVHPPERFYFIENGHMLPSGHRRIAEALLARLWPRLDDARALPDSELEP